MRENVLIELKGSFIEEFLLSRHRVSLRRRGLSRLRRYAKRGEPLIEY